MEQLQHKIITFLTRNAHLDVEAPDIAFHLKMDEKDVQSNLDKLLDMGVVSVQKNQYGRTYWYYVPQRSSMPFETMSTRIPQDISDFNEQQDSRRNGNHVVSIALFFSVFSLFLSLTFAIGLFVIVNQKNEAVREEFRNNVSKEELTTVVESAEARLGKIEAELKKTMIRVDSLKKTIAEMKSVPVVKHFSYQKNYRKR